MTTDVLNETVVDEAEAIVRAEWLRLQHDSPRITYAAKFAPRCPPPGPALSGPPP